MTHSGQICLLQKVMQLTPYQTGDPFNFTQQTPSPHSKKPCLYLTAFQSIWQAPQLPIGYSHVELAHGTVLQTPAFSIIIHQLCCLAWEKQSFFIVLEEKKKKKQGVRLRRKTQKGCRNGKSYDCLKL